MFKRLQCRQEKKQFRLGGRNVPPKKVLRIEKRKTFWDKMNYVFVQISENWILSPVNEE